MLKRTALFENHRAAGGRLIDFGGWELPVQYTGVLDEHTTCRKAVGLFDVSHMGEFLVDGPDSEAFLNYCLTNDVSTLVDGQAQYTVLCQHDGGIVDDLLVYKRSAGSYLVVVNASNVDKDFDWMSKTHREKNFQCSFRNVSSEYTQIAIQGRFAEKTLQKLTRTDLSKMAYYHFAEGSVLGEAAFIARTGYTGEDGFEVYLAWDKGPALWDALLDAGKEFGIKPCGLGARDSLRLEVKFPLYGNELDSQTNPLEAGLGWVTKLGKSDFVGKTALETQKMQGIKKRLVGVKLLGAGIPRQGYKILHPESGEAIGVITSGTHAPSIGAPIALGYVPNGFEKVGTKLVVEIRNQKVPAEVTPTPFYKRDY